jgi:hypothetical protein
LAGHKPKSISTNLTTQSKLGNLREAEEWSARDAEKYIEVIASEAPTTGKVGRWNSSVPFSVLILHKQVNERDFLA